MSTPSDIAGPSPTATVLRSEDKPTRSAIRFGGVLLALGTGLAVFVILLAAGVVGPKGKPNLPVLGGLVVPLLLGYPGFRLIRIARRRLRIYQAVDSTGLWAHDSNGRGLIRWDSLAALAIQQSNGDDNSPSATTRSLDLCPKDTIDRDHPVLWIFVRDLEPFRPGLPNLRYRMTGPAGSVVDRIIEAVKRHAPSDLWAGEFEREPGYDPGPDRDGHWERLGKRTA